MYRAFYGVADLNPRSKRYAHMIGPRILCVREIQDLLANSSKQVIEDVIAEWNLGWFFNIGRSASRRPEPAPGWLQLPSNR